LPLLSIMLVGAWEVGRIIEVQQLLCNAVREGGRQASSGTQTTAQVQQYVVNYLNANGLTDVTATDVTFQDLTNPGTTDPTQAAQLDRLRVSVTLPYSRFRWSMVAQITNVTQLTASADWYSMMDSTLVVDTTIPAQ
jgi:Flp pilus assembly protein TadG